MKTSESSKIPHDHEQCLRNALMVAADLCQQRGVQLTTIRQQILTLIWANHQAVKAYDLLDQLKPLKNEAKPATVYRALDFLIEQGLIHRIESLNAFIGCTDPACQHEQLLLICKQCHEVEERHGVQVMAALQKELNNAGFSAHSKAVEIHGFCKNCLIGNKLLV